MDDGERVGASGEASRGRTLACGDIWPYRESQPGRPNLPRHNRTVKWLSTGRAGAVGGVEAAITETPDLGPTSLLLNKKNGSADEVSAEPLWCL